MLVSPRPDGPTNAVPGLTVVALLSGLAIASLLPAVGPSPPNPASGEAQAAAHASVTAEAGGAERGFAVAADGDWLAIGARFAEASTGVVGVALVPRAGAVHLFHWEDGAWRPRATFGARKPRRNGQFGSALALRGATLAVGAPGERAAYVFAREGESWRQKARVVGTLEERFGTAVATDGEVLAVGAPGARLQGRADSRDGGNAGQVHVYKLEEGAWRKRQTLAPAELRAGDRFGQALALAGDTLAVGAPGREGVYTFTRGPRRWLAETFLNAPEGGAGDQLGTAVALAGDQLAAGAPFADLDGDNAGAVYVAERRDGRGGWGRLVRLPAGAVPGARLGTALALDTEVLAAGAPQAGGPRGAGAVHLFFPDGDGGWIAAAPLSGRHDLDLFGFAVGLSGGRLVVGLPLGDAAGGNSGDAAAYFCDDEGGCSPGSALDFAFPPGPELQ